MKIFSEYTSAEENVIISEEYTHLEDHVFTENETIVSVQIDALIEEIGYLAFYKCTNLKRISLPSTVKVIEEGAFESCKKLEEIKLPPALTRIDKSAFRSCSTLKEIAIPLSVKSIGITAFKFCKGLKKAYIPKTVTKIGKEAFAKCPDLTIVTTAGSAAEKYTTGEGIPVQIVSAAELEDIIRVSFIVEDLLSIQLKKAQKTGPATIVSIGENRVLIKTNIWYGTEEEYRKHPYIDGMRQIPTPLPNNWYVKHREAIEQQVAKEAESAVEFAIGYIAFDKEKIQRPTDDELEQLYGDFAKICHAFKRSEFSEFISSFLPKKKNGSLHVGRKVVLAKLPVFIQMHDEADMRHAHSFDLVAKIESESEVVISIEWVDLVKTMEQDYHSFANTKAIMPFDEMATKAAQYV